MDCKRFEELLIDFIENELDPSEVEAVKKHVSICSYCSREVEEYKEIRRMLDEEIPFKPSSEVLVKLSKIARDRIERDKTPFWKRWFYSPILVPVLSSALALFLWVSYGQNNLDLFFRDKNMYSTEVMAKKIPSAQEPNLPIAGERTLDLELGQGRILSKEPSPVIPKGRGAKSGIEAAAPVLAPSDELPAKELKEIDKISDLKAETFAGSLESKPINEPLLQQPTEKGFAKGEVRMERQSEEQIVGETRDDKQRIEEAELYSNLGDFYENKLDIALKQQREGNCEASIKTNEELLKTSPPPPNSVAEKAYFSLAECYEQMGDLDNALVNYQNLGEIATEKADFAKNKIEGLEQKISFLKARELKPSGTEEGQKTK